MMKLKGSVTVFMSMILSILIAFSGVMVDLSRLQAGKKHAQAAVQLSVQSALTQYHAPMKEHYGLMLTGNSQEELEVLVGELLEKNLASENRYMSGYTDLFGFEVQNVTVTPFFNPTEDYVLEQQITQFMKYRAPANTIGNFIEKLRALNTYMAQSGLLNKKMSLEKQLQKIREEQVYLKLLFSERIHGFSSNRKPGKELGFQIDMMNANLVKIEKMEAPNAALDTSWMALAEPVEKISEAQNQINLLDSDIASLETDLASCRNKYDDLDSKIDSLNDDIDDLEKKIQKLEKAISKENEKKNPNQSSITNMQSEIKGYEQSVIQTNEKKVSLTSESSEVSERIGKIESSIAGKNSEIEQYQRSVQTEREILQTQVDSCVSILQQVEANAGLIHFDIQRIITIIEKYISYHQEALKLIDEIKTGCEKVQKCTTDIQSEMTEQSKQSDNAFLTRMKADIQKLVLNADPNILVAIRADVDANLSILHTMMTDAENTGTQMLDIQNSLDDFLDKTKEIPKNCSIFTREIYHTRINELVEAITAQIEASIVGYKNPEYSVEPRMNQKEKNEFLRWCNRTFGEENETDTSKDKGQQKKLKQNIEKSDTKNRENEKTFQGSDEDLSDKALKELFASLPSFRDKEGNYPNIVNSENTPSAEEAGNLLTGEEKKVDAEQSYEDALEQNGNMAKIIGEILSGAGEGLIKSMYVNEYIVCLFKNANMKPASGTKILLNGGPKTTFYDKAEVEYILFGTRKEKTNANLVQLAIFGLRMGLNLIHVYTNPDKSASAMTAATAIAGWTGFGVPIVKNLILMGWAAGESWIDVKKINDGEDVPVYKTKGTWTLDLKSLFSGIANEIIDDSSKWLKQTKDEWIDDGDKALRSVVGDIISSAVHEAFLPLEETIVEFGEEVEAYTAQSTANIQLPGEISSMEDLKEWITEAAGSQVQSVAGEAVEWTKQKLEAAKTKITDKIQEILFNSTVYKNFKIKIKDGLDALIQSGTNQISDAIQQLGQKINDPGTKNQLVGTVVSFDYTDYLRLLLFVVPQKIKLLRICDLMQLNMQKTLDNPDFIVSGYHSFLIVEADISIRYLFIPRTYNQEQSGQIKIRWGYGY